MKFLTWLGVVVAVGLLAGGVAVGIAVVVRTDLFNWDNALATADLEHFVGLATATVGAAATALGLLFTLAYNHRTHSLAEQTEARSNVEAAALFLGLITSKDGKYAAPGQVSGAVWSLVALGHRTAALGVAQSALSQNALDAPTAARLVSTMLDGTADAEQITAAGMLRSIAPQLGDADGFEWPLVAYDRWDTKRPLEAKNNILVAMADLLASNTVGWWIPNKAAWAALLSLDASAPSEKDGPIRNGAAYLLDTIVDAVDATAPDLVEFQMNAVRRVTVEELRAIAVERRPPNEHRGVSGDLLTADQSLRVSWGLPSR